jgi:hypothetical protein
LFDLMYQFGFVMRLISFEFANEIKKKKIWDHSTYWMSIFWGNSNGNFELERIRRLISRFFFFFLVEIFQNGKEIIFYSLRDVVCEHICRLQDGEVNDDSNRIMCRSQRWRMQIATR